MEFINKLIFSYPLAVELVFVFAALGVSTFLSLWGGRKFYAALAGRNQKMATATSFIWYILLFTYFSILFFTLPYAILIDFGVSQYDLGRLDFAGGNYPLILFFIFLIGGAVAFFSLTKKQAIPPPANISLLRAIWLGTKKTLLVVLLVFAVLVASRGPAVQEKQLTVEIVSKIHSQKITLDDVLGKNLPPDPGTDADKTIQGIDANHNGIRDDVELAIFKEYQDSAKTRAALLQYALALQMEITQPIVNESVVGEVANKQDRSIFCIAKIIPGGREGSVIIAIEKYGGFITKRQFNTKDRKIAHKAFYKYLKSGRIDDSTPCDIEITSLQN